VWLGRTTPLAASFDTAVDYFKFFSALLTKEALACVAADRLNSAQTIEMKVESIHEPFADTSEKSEGMLTQHVTFLTNRAFLWPHDVVTIDGKMAVVATLDETDRTRVTCLIVRQKEKGVARDGTGVWSRKNFEKFAGKSRHSEWTVKVARIGCLLQQFREYQAILSCANELIKKDKNEVLLGKSVKRRCPAVNGLTNLSDSLVGQLKKSLNEMQVRIKPWEQFEASEPAGELLRRCVALRHTSRCSHRLPHLFSRVCGVVQGG